MADEDLDHLGPQLRQPTLVDKKGALPGTPAHPQGRLFATVGMHSGDPFKLAPENWMKQPAEGGKAAHDDVISWHASESSAPPRYDDPYSRQLNPEEFAGPDWNNAEFDDEGNPSEDFIDHSVDSKGRPMTTYGSAVGMHLGDIAAGMTRAKDTFQDREHIHPLRIPADTVADPPRGTFATGRPGGSIAGGNLRSNNVIVNKETGERTKDTRWEDTAANFAEKATDLVASGKTIAYRNDYEATGSTSFRTLPETTRTWSEDVLGARSPRTGMPPDHEGGPGHKPPDLKHGFRNEPHPALVHLAERGYNPVQRQSELPPAAPENKDRRQAFEEGKSWHLRKPKPDDEI